MEQFKEIHLDKDKKKQIKADKVFINNKYEVMYRIMGEWLQLSIRAINKQALHDWRDFQEIKNMICGNEREAIEIYPAESRLVDSSNQYFLWVLPEGEKVPIGFKERFIVKGHKKEDADGSVQRPFKKDPIDAKSIEEAIQKTKEYLQNEE